MHSSVTRIQVGVLGASGYAGRELCGLLLRHPSFSLSFATANEQRGQTVRFGSAAVTYVATEDAPLDSVRLVFCALPHGAAQPRVQLAREAGARVLDLYHDMPPRHAVFRHIPYGMPEVGAETRNAVRSAQVVAN